MIQMLQKFSTSKKWKSIIQLERNRSTLNCFNNNQIFRFFYTLEIFMIVLQFIYRPFVICSE